MGCCFLVVIGIFPGFVFDFNVDGFYLTSLGGDVSICVVIVVIGCVAVSSFGVGAEGSRAGDDFCRPATGCIVIDSFKDCKMVDKWKILSSFVV